MRLLSIALCAALLAAPLCAHATDGGGDSEAARQQRAKTIWDEGARRYDLGKFDDAIELFLKSYETWPYPAILFNLCQAYRQESEYKKAIFYCKSYLRNLPNAANRADVEDLVREMEETQAKQAATNDRPPDGIERPAGPTQPIIREGGSRSGAWKWAAIGAGVAAAAVGLTLIALDEDDFDAAGRRNENPRDTMLPGVVLSVAGGALIGTGVVLWIAGGKGEGRARTVAVGYGIAW